MNWKIDAPNFVERLNSPRSFYLTEFSAGAVKSLNDRINEAIDLGQPIFSIYIESTGGDIFSLFAMMSIISSARKKGLKIATICSGFAASAAAFIFCLGDEGLRFIGEHGTIMIHGFGVGNIEGKVREQREFLGAILNREDSLLQTVSHHLKGSRRKDWLKHELSKRKDADWFITPSEAIAIGIANHIGIPSFSLKLIPEVSIEL